MTTITATASINTFLSVKILLDELVDQGIRTTYTRDGSEITITADAPMNYLAALAANIGL